ncbi:MAG: hypothetical protein ABH839_01020 [Chloroflexota bacterium]
MAWKKANPALIELLEENMSFDSERRNMFGSPTYFVNNKLLFVFSGIPEHIRSDNGLEITSRAIRKWLTR